MATLCATSCSSFSKYSSICRKTHFSFSLFSTYNPKRLNFYAPNRKGLNLYVPNRKRLIFSVKAEKEDEGSSSSVAVASEENDSSKNHESGSQHESESESERIEREKQQEMDWKTDEEFKKFMGNPSIETAIKLEKKRTDRKLKELDSETSSNPLVGFFKNLVRDSLSREKERLEKAEEAFVALDLNKVIFCLNDYVEVNLEVKLSLEWVRRNLYRV